MNLIDFTLKDYLQAYEKKALSPVEAVKFFLERIKTHNSKLNAYLWLNEKEVLEQAQKLEKVDPKSKPLYGIALSIKDIFLVKGLYATAASKILQGYVAPYTATCVQRLIDAGALVLGKVNLDEFAMGSSNENSAFGSVSNPWNLQCVPGGSSGGSSASVSARLCVGSLGTDTGGSIRQPASLSGIVGLKPTYGRVSRYGIIAFASSLDQAGPMATTSWDAAKLLEVMAGFDPKDSTSSQSEVPKYTEQIENLDFKKLKVGVPWKWFEKGIDEEVKEVVTSSIRKLEKEGAKIIEIELPHAHYSLSTYYLLAPSEASSNLARYDGVHYGFRSDKAKTGRDIYFETREEGFGPEVKLRIMLGTFALSSGYYDAYYLKANQVRKLIQDDFTFAFNKVDCIILPTSPTTAFKKGEKAKDPIAMYQSDIFTLPVNLAGLPAISLPCGLDSKKLPIGLQVIGRHFDELLLLQVANAFEKLVPNLPLPSEVCT